MRKLLPFIILIFTSVSLFAQYSEIPKREFRGAWVASVTNLDWPSTPNKPVSVQKAELINIFDTLAKDNFNTVIFQIRPECDALYKSPYEPWSYWLTGTQGKAPDPEYDPLEFAIEEAHKRGLEIHAWFNPYRAVKTVGAYSTSSNHITNTHPDWILDFGSMKILDPGLPEVREYNVKIVMDVVRRYDIDGVHMDDYFYPYPPNQISNQDSETYDQYKGDFTNVGEWRRNNVNVQMDMIMDSIDTEKPDIKFGISPFGIWKNGVPSGINGMDAYNVIYADPIAWLKDESVDYLSPQLYWQIGGGQDFVKLQKFWSDSTAEYNRHIYPGSIFRAGYANDQLPRQLQLNRDNENVQGTVLFKASNVIDNTYNFQDSLRANYYRYPSLVPVMDWKDTDPTGAPSALAYNKSDNTGRWMFTWDKPADTGADSAVRYVLYRFDDDNVTSEDLNEASNIIKISGHVELDTDIEPTEPGTYYFGITALDRNNNESEISNLVELAPPAIPAAVYPEDDFQFVSDTAEFEWSFPENASKFNFELAADENFENILVSEYNMETSKKTVTGLTGLTTYFWRVNAENAAGQGEYSETFQFRTGFPVPPVALLPEDENASVSINSDYIWSSAPEATEYRLQIAISRDFRESTVVVDTVVADTSVFISGLEPGRFHFWRAGALNEYGFSDWSGIHFYKTSTSGVKEESAEVPSEYSLGNNYPNPFNPSTLIEFAIPERANVNLYVVNILGETVAQLVNREMAAGKYSYNFSAENLPSGVYIYIMKAGKFTASKKMILMK